MNCISVPTRIRPQYADSPKNIPVFSLFFLISEGSFFNNSGTDVPN
ncbi:hypothetical protein PQZ45_02245 [Candidatus Pelagibacter sp.]|nr:hypothetical protein [Candidatus Pelagibacter sp.]